MTAKFGYATQGMFSFLTKEANYGGAVTVNSTNFITLKGAKIKVEWPDDVQDDGDMITGYEFPTSQEILQSKVKITITEDRAHPSFVAAAMSMALGSLSAVQDGVLVAYRNKAIPIANSGSLPSINGIVVIGGGQYLYKGLVADSVKLSASKDGYLTCELVLVGNGTRDVNADSFVTPLSESWLKARNIRCWKESGANISIDAVPTQGSENISSATPTALASRFRSFDFSWTNGIDFQLDNIGVDIGRRKATFKISLWYNDTTEEVHYKNQDTLAFEIDLDSGTVIAGGGVMKSGTSLIIPASQLKTAPLPDGGDAGRLSQDLDVTIKDDGTNPVVISHTYTAQAAFLA